MAISVTNDTTWPVPAAQLESLAEFLYAELRLHPETELAVTLVGSAEMTELHLKWMDEPGPTDVLSFPMDELTPTPPGQEPVAGILGDVVICPEIAAAQGEAAGHGLQAEIELLLTHGVLHLLGYDHAEPAEHAEMFARQDRLLALWRGRRGAGGDR
ncbi:MAG: rRNA maturation RNase YbeY [Candidatus Nanopelagicales bacterium]